MNTGPYNLELQRVPPGRPFMMVNYPGLYIRVVARSDNTIKLIRHAAMGPVENKFEGDFYCPIVELATGNLFLMAKEKPCLVYPGEHVG